MLKGVRVKFEENKKKISFYWNVNEWMTELNWLYHDKESNKEVGYNNFLNWNGIQQFSYLTKRSYT